MQIKNDVKEYIELKGLVPKLNLEQLDSQQYENDFIFDDQNMNQTQRFQQKKEDLF